MALNDISADGVLTAMREYDRIGEEAFFEKYGFEAATKYWVKHDGKRYASKAVANVAQALGMKRSYSHDIRIGGGEQTVVRRLRELGFEVPIPLDNVGRNPTWNRDELILALDLYMTNPANPPGKGSKAVAILSDLLNRLHRLNGSDANDTLRNANGVYLKMMNLRSLDPQFIAQGKVGMTSGGKLEKVIWAEYVNRRAALASDAAAIRQAILSASHNPVSSPEDDYEGSEGGIVLRLHKLRERDTKLIAKKKRHAKAAGKLACEVCEFDFAKRYGELGVDYIEVHHINPISLMVTGTKTKLSDLALLCSNCHRMAHRKRLPLSLEQLRAAIRG
jgi:5-methylcytosine-specific restriction protein A